MAKPRVFVSSTYYDLKHIRASLENFVETLGFEAVLSEKGKVPYAPDMPLDESCYREASNADIFVLIIGGRSGSEASSSRRRAPKEFFDQYNSITREEYRTAVEKEIPIYVMVERAVYSEYETYLRNKGNTKVSYAHVDSVNVFELIEFVLGQRRNNAMQTFDRYAEIETWLREQWAGYFQELLRRMHGQTQLSSLQKEVEQLSETNTTLKRYVEQVLTKVAPGESVRMIQLEEERLKRAALDRAVKVNPLARFVGRHFETSDEKIERAAVSAKTLDDFFLRAIGPSYRENSNVERILGSPTRKKVFSDLNDLRKALNASPLPAENPSVEQASEE